MRCRREGGRLVKIRLCVALAGVALVLTGPVMAKSVRHAHHAHSERRTAQPHYDYRSASLVREEFIDAPRGRWMRSSRDTSFDRYAYRERGEVVENLRGDFTGGVGYGADGFVDGYGQTHYFVGGFRSMNPLPHGPYTPNRFAPRGRGF
jgi:hypothetical protein